MDSGLLQYYEEKRMMEAYTQEYIGDFWKEDVTAFCNAIKMNGQKSKTGTKLVENIEKSKKKYPTFVWPAFIFHSLWFVYRGMMVRAIVLDAIKIVMLLIGVAISSEEGAVRVLYVLGYVIYGFFLGLYAVPWYDKYVTTCLKERKLEKREYISCDELKESLARQGKPSLGRAVFYSVLQGMIFFIVKAMFFIG